MIQNSLTDAQDSTIANLALITAVKAEDFQGAAAALKSSADPDSTLEEGNDVFALVHLAAKNGDSLCLSLLVSYGANIESKTLHGWEPLHLAAYHGQIDCVTILLKANADVNCINHYGQTPLMMAVGQDHTHCTRTLLRWNADIHKQSQTAKKSKAMDMVKSVEMMKIMMSKGDRDTLHGRSNLDIVRLTLENISKNLEEEAARYELTEKE